MPRVSICIPAYKPDFFELALRSALAQSYDDCEILVSDDCPTDAIEAICARYADKVSYSRNPKPSQINNIIRLATIANGEYIKFLFDDDVLNPFCVQYLLEALEGSRDLGTVMAFSPRYFINETNRVTRLVNYFKVENDAKIISGRDYIRLTAINHINLVGEYTATLFRKKDCFDENGVFCLYRLTDGYFAGTLDLSGWLELAQRGAFVAHPHPLSYFRQHSNSSSNHTISKTFIHVIRYPGVILEFARKNGYLEEGDLPVAYKNLLREYRYWAPHYPELNPLIEEISGILSGKLHAG